MNLPIFNCRNKVRAAIITDILISDIDVILELGKFGRISKSANWVIGNDVAVGGYYILFADGYTSFCPANLFESGYKGEAYGRA